MDDFNALFDKYFIPQPDTSITFVGSKLVIQIPETFIEKGISSINRTTVTTIGIFDGYIFDDYSNDNISDADHKFTLKIPSNIFLTPSHIEKSTRIVERVETETFEKENIYNLIFLEGDTFMLSSNVVQECSTVDNFMYMLLNGQIPKNIKYDELPNLWLQCSIINGSGTLGSDFSIFGMIISNLVRDPQNFSVPFRLVCDKYFSKGIMNGKMMSYQAIPRYISNFTAITGSDPRQGITVAMARVYGDKEKDVKSPIEEVIE